MTTLNEHRQPVGEPLGAWEPPPFPPGDVLAGRTARLDPLDPIAHAGALYEVFADAPDSLWTYMAFGPFTDARHLEETLQAMVGYPDWVPYTIVVGDQPLGFASYLRIQPRDGVIEIGSITFSPRLQRTTAATESIYLMIRHCFDLGYRRCEWKCDDLNEPSREAAVRLGFTYEGTFRKATWYKGRNRDTAWYSIVDTDWPALDSALRRWLSPENFDADGQQRRTLRHSREGN